MLRKIKPLENMSKNEIITLINQYSKPGLSRDEVIRIVLEKINALYEYSIIYSKEASLDWFTGESGKLYSNSNISFTNNGYTHILMAWVDRYNDLININLHNIWFTDKPILMPMSGNVITLRYAPFVFDLQDYVGLGNNNKQNPQILIHFVININSNKISIQIFNTNKFNPVGKTTYGLVVYGLKKKFKAFNQIIKNIINNIRNLYYSPLSLI